MPFFEPIRNFYGKFERPISSLSLISGFLFDILTLKRVDTLWENFWVLAHIIIVGVFIALIHTKSAEAGDEKNPTKAHFWYVNILQFFFGGLLSTFLVFYFRSADILTTWPFIAILAFAFIANESFKRHYVRLSFQISLFYLSVYSFAIFLVPVLLHKIGDKIFLISGVVSLVFILLFLAILFHFIKDKFKESKKLIFFLIFGIFVSFNFLYFTNLIPPIPLSLKDAGVYHTIHKNSDGNYEVTGEVSTWHNYFNLYPDFKVMSGLPVYAYSAIFSPTNLNTTILHQWQHYDETSKKWITDSTINLSVLGGRGGGFRTYSVRSNLAPGKWRVNIETTTGQNIGQIRFTILSVNTEPALVDEIKY